MRRWSNLVGPSLHGCDYNPKLVAWCRHNLTFASFKTNGLAPPLPYEDQQFDLIYCVSVFTHLTEPLQHAWMAELHRVLRPGGLLVFSTRGDAHRERLNEQERAIYDAGDLVVRYSGVEGTNLCGALHPRRYLEEKLLTSFKLLESRPAALVDGAQDLHAAECLP
jgi:SAM-dependent methyltransferase